jgi:SM-20-related protein
MLQDIFIAEYEKLADDLATQGYGILDGFLFNEEVSRLRNYIAQQRAEGELQKAGIGSGLDYQIDKSVRGDLIQWIDSATAGTITSGYIEKLKELSQYLNRTLFLSLKDAEIHYTVYPIGTVYQRHLDQFRQNDHRKLSVLCYLNEDWQETDGGQLRMYLPTGTTETQLDILPQGGRLVIFRSDLLEHEVLAASRPRYSLTGWLLDQLSDLTHL